MSRRFVGVFCLMLLALLSLCSKAALAQPKSFGWRGDGSGRFEDAQPPTKWSKDSANIVWKTDIESGYSSPVLCDGRLFLTAQPSNVICLDAASGEEIWRRPAGYDVALGDDEAARIAKIQDTLEAERRKLGKRYDELRKAEPEAPELEKLKQARKAVDERHREFQRQYPPEKRGGAGNAAATIVCDGEHVFAVFGTGIVTAFNLDGKRLWMRHLEAPQQGFGHSASPLLAGGRLLIHIERLTALDPATGKTAWQVEAPAKFGSPTAARIGGRDVVITPSGALVAADDGSVIAEKQFSMSNNSPLVHDDKLYVHEAGRTKAFRLPDSLQAPVELKLLWESSAPRDQRMASAIFHDGLLYAGGRRGVIDVTDASTGESVYRKRLDIGELFASPVLAGGLIFYAGRDGKTLVLRPGREYSEVSINTSDRLSTSPVFQGRRMYLRTARSLCCIESSPTDDM